MDYRHAEVKRYMQNLGVPPQNCVPLNGLIVQAALERGLNVKRHGKGIALDAGGAQRFTWARAFTNFNVPLARRVADNKEVASRLLSAYGVTSTDNAVFTPDEAERAWQWAKDFPQIVVKPTDSLRGQGVHLGIDNREDFFKAFASVSERRSKRVLVEQFYRGAERRCLTVDGKFVAATNRRPASVVGDGTSTISDLVAEKNIDRPLAHYPLVVDEDTVQYLAEQGFSPESVPDSGVRVNIARGIQLGRGGDAVDATEELTEEEIEFVEKAARALPGGRLIGMDVLFSRSPGDDPSRILELNSNPLISMHHFPLEGEPRDVAGAIVDAMFPGFRLGAAKSA